MLYAVCNIGACNSQPFKKKLYFWSFKSCILHYLSKPDTITGQKIFTEATKTELCFFLDKKKLQKGSPHSEAESESGSASTISGKGSSPTTELP